MTRKAGGYLRELVSVRGRPESASEHAALLWVLLSLREFLPIIKSWNAHTNVLRVKHRRKRRRRRRRRMTRPPVDLCVDDETISSDARARSLSRFGNASSFGRERERCVKYRIGSTFSSLKNTRKSNAFFSTRAKKIYIDRSTNPSVMARRRRRRERRGSDPRWWKTTTRAARWLVFLVLTTLLCCVVMSSDASSSRPRTTGTQSRDTTNGARSSRRERLAEEAELVARLARILVEEEREMEMEEGVESVAMPRDDDDLSLIHI